MTCIVGLVENGTVYLGGDSCVGYDWQGKRQYGDSISKVFKVDVLLFGSSGDRRAAQLVECGLVLPSQEKGQADLWYLVMVVSEQIRDLLKSHGQAKIESNQENSETAFLIGYHGGLYRMGIDYSIVQHIEPFDSIGSGYAFALGALEAIKDVDMKPKARIKTALRIAARYANGVDENFVIMKEGAK